MHPTSTVVGSLVAAAMILLSAASTQEVLEASASSGHVETIAAPDTRTFRQSLQGAQNRMDRKPSYRFQESLHNDGEEEGEEGRETSNQGQTYEGFPEGFLDGLESTGSSKSLPKDDSGFYEAPANNFANFVDFADRQPGEERSDDSRSHGELPSSSDHMTSDGGSFQSPLGKGNWAEGFLDHPEEEQEDRHSPSSQQDLPRHKMRNFDGDYKENDESYHDDDDEWYEKQDHGNKKSNSPRFARDDRSQSSDKANERFYHDDDDDEESLRSSAQFHRNSPSHRGFRQVSFLHPAFGGFYRGHSGGIFAFPPRHSNRPHQAEGNHLHAKPSNILGSGNFGIIRGGIFSDDDMPSRDSHSSDNYNHNPHNFFQGFQDFQPFIGPLNNALSNNERHVANPPNRVASGSHVTHVVHSTPASLISSTTATPTTHPVKFSTAKP